MLLHHHAVGVMVLNVVTATVPLCHMLHLQVVQLLRVGDEIVGVVHVTLARGASLLAGVQSRINWMKHILICLHLCWVYHLLCQIIAERPLLESGAPLDDALLE